MLCAIREKLIQSLYNRGRWSCDETIDVKKFGSELGKHTHTKILNLGVSLDVRHTLFSCVTYKLQQEAKKGL